MQRDDSMAINQECGPRKEHTLTLVHFSFRALITP